MHYLTFEATPAQVAAFGGGSRLAIDHANCAFDAELPEVTVRELRSDLLGS